MLVIVLRDKERLAAYHVKRAYPSAKMLKGIRHFYKTLYPQSNIELIRGY